MGLREGASETGNAVTGAVEMGAVEIDAIEIGASEAGWLVGSVAPDGFTVGEAETSSKGVDETGLSLNG